MTQSDPKNHPEPLTSSIPPFGFAAAIALSPFARRIAAALPAASVGLLIAGCQAISNNGSVKVDKPQPVAVYDFAFDVVKSSAEEGVQQSRQGPVRRIAGNLRPGETPAQNAAQLASLLSSAIVDELAKLDIPATRYSKSSPWPASGLVVRGEFLQLDEGNQLQRAAIGFGAGATEVLAQVEVFDLAQSRSEPIHVYGTGSGSKPKPGAIVTKNPYALAAKYAMSRNASEKDVRKLGKQIAQDIAKLQVGSAGSR